MQTRASVRTRCEKSVWLDFALSREYLGPDRGRKKKGDREGKRARQQGDSGRMRAFSQERKQKRVVERERVRMRTSADDAKYRVGGAECAVAHLS